MTTDPQTTRDNLIGYCLVASPNEVTFERAERLADAYRAAVLREAADAITDAIERDRAYSPRRSNDRAALGGAREIVLGLIDGPSRVADEEQQPETQAADPNDPLARARHRINYWKQTVENLEIERDRLTLVIDENTRRHNATIARVDEVITILTRVQRVHDDLAAKTDFTSPDDTIRRGAAARRIAAALDGWTGAEQPAAVAQPGKEA